VVHSKLPGAVGDIGETESKDVWARIAELLQSPVDTQTFGNFQALTFSGAPYPASACRLPSSQAESVFAALSGSAAILPAPGTVVHPGDVIQISLSLPTGGAADGALIVVDGFMEIVEGDGPFSLSYRVPSDKAGKIDITAQTFGSTTQNFVASTSVVVSPAVSLTAIIPITNTLQFAPVNAPYRLSVMGRYSDGASLDITAGSAGTTYDTQSGGTRVISVSPDGVIDMRGEGQETISISNSGKTAQVRVYVYPDGNIPGTQVTSVSAATYALAPLAPESIVSANFTATIAAAASLPLPTSLGGVEVRVTDSVGTERLAPLFYVSPTQINYQILPGPATGAAVVTIVRGDEIPAIETVLIDAVSPGLFAANADGREVAAGHVVRVKADNSQVFEPLAEFDPAQGRFVPRPIDLGPATDRVYLVLFGTGLRFNSGLAAVAAQVGGLGAEVQYAGQQPQFVGLDQVNLLLPRSLAGRGEVTVTLTIDGAAANPVKVHIKRVGSRPPLPVGG
jgi:uncharacterized protein (TIGR03437 family)